MIRSRRKNAFATTGHCPVSVGRSIAWAACLLFVSIVASSSATAETPGDATSWPQWRGSSQSGTGLGESYPISWSEDDHVAWKTAIAGLGGSTPVTHDNVSYLTTGV